MIHLHSHEQLDASGETEERLPDEVPRDDLEHLQVRLDVLRSRVAEVDRRLSLLEQP